MSIRKRALKMGWRELWPVWVVFGVIAAVGIVGQRMILRTPTTPRPLRGGEDLTLNLSDLEPDKVRLFAYPVTPQERVEFFVERNSRSDIAVAFAACRRCYRSGHYEQDGQLLCRHCNEPTERLSAGQTPGPEQDCKLISIVFERSGNLLVRGNAVRETFARWYSPVHAQGGRTSTEGRRGE